MEVEVEVEGGLGGGESLAVTPESAAAVPKAEDVRPESAGVV